MMAGFLSVPIMRPHHCWTIVHVSILAVLFLTMNADSEDTACGVELRVRRNTVYETFLGKQLRINCTVTFCNDSPPTVSWFKREKTDVPVNVSSDSHIKTKWKTLKAGEGISYLIFQNIMKSDSGAYHCRDGVGVSHGINVSVHDVLDVPSNDTKKNDTNSINSENKPDILMYVYLAAGILAFVIIVIAISVASLHGCKGKPKKKETQTDNQYMAIPMVEHPFQHDSLQASPRGSPSEPPSRRSTRKKTPTPSPSQPNDSPTPKDNEHLYGKVKGGRGRQRNTAEEEGSVVYAALNHQAAARPDARPRRPQEKSSEYAAIRVKN
ncbi:hypothetical protein D9C73_000585 [Collichthys lucidus]|uniref:Ig-like domain-containing protein n=1 Tax=Collichthys lucidus TaxID=240159 RepID=A0A4U5TYU5_COLLU|nr:hypothetical protein D9C73_000585 [Collichthys lucidus]